MGTKKCYSACRIQKKRLDCLFPSMVLDIVGSRDLGSRMLKVSVAPSPDIQCINLRRQWRGPISYGIIGNGLSLTFASEPNAFRPPGVSLSVVAGSPTENGSLQKIASSLSATSLIASEN